MVQYWIHTRCVFRLKKLSDKHFSKSCELSSHKTLKLLTQSEKLVVRNIEKSFDFCQGGESQPKNDKHKLFESKITELGGALELAL